MEAAYNPYHLVDYYRYLRFFPDGHVQALTSSADPQHVGDVRVDCAFYFMSWQMVNYLRDRHEMTEDLGTGTFVHADDIVCRFCFIHINCLWLLLNFLSGEDNLEKAGQNAASAELIASSAARARPTHVPSPGLHLSWVDGIIAAMLLFNRCWT